MLSPGTRDPLGSEMMVKPSVYVATSVTKSATSCRHTGSVKVKVIGEGEKSQLHVSTQWRLRLHD
jgi:hypothetical protein